MPLSFNLTFAEIPFVSDVAKIIRQNPLEVPRGQVDQQAPIRAQQEEVNLIDEVNRLIPFHDLNDFRLYTSYHGRNLGALATEQYAGQGRSNPHDVKVGQWYYPVGATRWSVFRGLATSSQVKAMLAATYNPVNPTPAQWPIGFFPERVNAGSIPALLSITAQPLNPISELGYTVESMMYMLPPRPLGETLGADGLFLITLVDSRYFWQYAPTSALMAIIPTLSTWEGYIANLATALGVEINFSSPIPEAYTGPEPDSQLWINMENCAVLLDAIAYNLGCRVVRNLNGSYTLQRPAESAETITLNRSVTSSQRLAGGNIFDPTPTLNTGSRATAVNQVLPNSVNVSFPLYCPLNKPVPHFLNARTVTAQRSSVWYEESYGDVWIQNVPIGTVTEGLIGVVAETGAIEASADLQVAPYVHAIHTTAKALVPNDGSLTLLNEAGVVVLAQQIAADYYAWQAGISLDEVYQGTVAWQPEGGHDVVWTYSERMRLASCRVTRTQWNSIIQEMQHTTPTAPEVGVFTNNPPGVGGPSVAQSWKDSIGSEVKSALSATLLATDKKASFSTVDSLPTQNRWNATIDDEMLQFDGTSGGILDPDDPPSYLVTVAQMNDWNSEGGNVYARGINSTIPAAHETGAAVIPVIPNATHGVNVVTVEKGQYAHPSDWGEGIQGVNLKPQIQTVFVWSASGQNHPNPGIFPYYSGTVVIPQPDNQGYQFLEPIWVQERNNNAVISGHFYEGQFFAYSINPYFDAQGEQVPTAGAVNPIYLISQDPLAISETAIISLTSTTGQKVKIKDTLNPNCEVVVVPGQIWRLIDCTWTAWKGCWFIQQNADLPPLNIRIIARLEEVDTNGIPIYSRETLPTIVQVTSTEPQQIELEDGSSLVVFPGNVQVLDGGTWVNVAKAWFFPLNGGEVPQAPYNYSCQVVSIEKDTGVEVWGCHLSDMAVISLNSIDESTIETTGGGDGGCKTIVRPATIWALIGCTWQNVGECWYTSLQSDIPPPKMRFLARRVEMENANNISGDRPVYARETLSAVIQVQALTLVSIKMNGKSFQVYQGTKQVLVNGAYANPLTQQVWFTPLNSITPSLNRRYNCQMVGIDDSGREIWGDNPSTTAIISITSHGITNVKVSGNNGLGCTVPAMSGLRWRFDGCNWILDGACWFVGPNEDVPPLCVKFVAKQTDIELATGVPVYSKEMIVGIIQVTSLQTKDVLDCGGTNSNTVYPAEVVSLEGAAWQERTEAWFYPLNNETPALNTRYSCQLIGFDEHLGVGIWGTHLGGLMTGQNVNAPLNKTSPVFTILADNDQQSSKHGRIFISQVDTNTIQLDWQGLRIFHDSTGPQGPEPDINLLDGTFFFWSIVADDPALGVVNVQGEANILAIELAVIQYIINNMNLLCQAIKDDCITCTYIKDCIDCTYIQDCIDCNYIVSLLASPECVNVCDFVLPCVRTLYANLDCTSPALWPDQMDAVYAANLVGGKFDDTHDFGHIIWVPPSKNSDTCKVDFPGVGPIGGPGGYFSWQGIRLRDPSNHVFGPEEDIQFIQGICGPNATANPSINIICSDNPANNSVRAAFSTIGCTGTFYISYLSNVSFDPDTCFLTPTYTRLIVTLNCGLIVNVQCSQDSQGGCNVNGLTC